MLFNFFRKRPQEPESPIYAVINNEHTKSLQEAADTCLKQTGEEQYFQDEFIDIFVNGKHDPTAPKVTYVQVKPYRGSTQRRTVLLYNTETKYILEYHAQEDFWEEHLLKTAENFSQILYDIPKKDKRREALENRKKLEELLSSEKKDKAKKETAAVAK